MATTTQHRRGRSGQQQRVNKRGLYHDEQWWCDCKPRKKAPFREITRADSKYVGHWFYSCGGYPDCGMWLLDTDANKRIAALTGTTTELPPGESPPKDNTSGFTQKRVTSFFTPQKDNENASRNETGLETPSKTGNRTMDKGKARETAAVPQRGETSAAGVSTLTAPISPPPTSNSPAKRKQDVLARPPQPEEDDEYGMSAELEDDMFKGNWDKPQPATNPPAIAVAAPDDVADQHAREVLSRPSVSTSRPLFGQTPRAGGSRIVDATANDDGNVSNKRHKTSPSRDGQLGVEPTRQRPSTPPAMPPPSTLPSRLQPPSTGGTNTTTSPETPRSSPVIDVEAIMSLLRSKDLDASTLAEVETRLSTSARRANGTESSRDWMRSALRKSDAKADQMRNKIADLESQAQRRESDLTNIKAGLMRLQDCGDLARIKMEVRNLYIKY